MRYLIDLILWFILSIAILHILLVIFYRTGIVFTNREKDGTLKKKMPIKGFITMAVFFILIILFFILFDIYTFSNEPSVDIKTVLIMNFFLLLLFDIYDAIVVDLIILGKIKPKFLHLPKDVTLKSMKYHVKKQFTVGWILKLPIVVISTILYISII
jgi:heme/copper-type cytochrome/quinol oxidase subunit 2